MEKFPDEDVQVYEYVCIFTLAEPESHFCVRRLDQRDDGSAIQEYLAEKTGQRTVPNVFISAYQSLSSHTHGTDHEPCRR